MDVVFILFSTTVLLTYLPKSATEDPGDCQVTRWMKFPRAKQKWWRKAKREHVFISLPRCLKKCEQSDACISIDRHLDTSCYINKETNFGDVLRSYYDSHWDRVIPCTSFNGKEYVYLYMGLDNSPKTKWKVLPRFRTKVACLKKCGDIKDCLLVTFRVNLCLYAKEEMFVSLKGHKVYLKRLKASIKGIEPLPRDFGKPKKAVVKSVTPVPIQKQKPKQAPQSFSKVKGAVKSSAIAPKQIQKYEEYCVNEKLDNTATISNSHSWEKSQICWTNATDLRCSYDYVGHFTLVRHFTKVAAANPTHCLIMCNKNDTCQVASYHTNICQLETNKARATAERQPKNDWFQFYKRSCEVRITSPGGAATYELSALQIMLLALSVEVLFLL